MRLGFGEFQNMDSPLRLSSVQRALGLVLTEQGVHAFEAERTVLVARVIAEKRKLEFEGL